MTNSGALQGVRVLDLTDDTGRFATKLLTEAGADVLRLGRGSPGAPMQGEASRHGGLLDWWYDGGKQRLTLDLHSAAGQEQFRQLAAQADLLVETEPLGRLATLGLDYPQLQDLNPRLVQVSLTPFGRQGPRAPWQVSDLVAAALGGVLSITGTPDTPLNGWGRQCFNTAGFFAAICSLAGLHAARATGRGQHIDLSLQQSVIACTEQMLMYWFFPQAFPSPVAARRASVHWTGAYEVTRCATGYAMVTPASTHVPQLLDMMEADGMIGDLRQLDLTNILVLLAELPRVMTQLKLWAATKDAHEMCLAAQERHISFGEVLSVAGVANGPHLQARGFFRPVEGMAGAVTIPGPLFRLSDTPAPAPQAPRTADIAAVQQHWSASPPQPQPLSPTSGKPLAGVRVLDFTWVLAGPYCTRVLADLGAEVIKIQTESRARAVNDNAHPYFVLWNRGKRSVTLNMKHPQAVATFRRLVEKSDVIVDNFSAGVLERWGIGHDAASQWNAGIISMSMSGAGENGPWKDFVTYAPTIHALCGLTHLTNPPERRDIGMGFALTDHVSGLAGAVAILQALEARRRTGKGQRIDLAQLEVGTYLVGPALADFLSNGREAQPVGNRDAFVDHVPNEVYHCQNDEWLAVTARDDLEWQQLCDAIGAGGLGRDRQLATLEGRQEHRDQVNSAIAAWAVQQDATEAMHRLQAAGVPAGKVCTMRDLTEADEQLAARQWLAAMESPLLGRHVCDRFPATFDGAALEPQRSAPSFGEHNFEIYAELLGMTQEEIATAIGDGLFA